MSISLNQILLICILLVRIESRRSLRNYIVSQDSHLNGLITNDYSVYDPKDNDLICRLQSLDYTFNSLSNLISYPSEQTIASIRNVWSPFLYQSYFNVLDDQLNQWIKGQIFQRYRPQGFQFTIKYGENSYIMENKPGSSITEIRDLKRPNYILTQFSRTYFNPLFGSSIYNIRIYTDDLPDPIYILALYALDSTTTKRRIRYIPQLVF